MVGGSNFGLGSSREHAPTIIKVAGVSAVMAKSFARIFFRNSINVGLPALICDTDQIDQGDELEVDLTAGKIDNKTKGIVIEFKKVEDSEDETPEETLDRALEQIEARKYADMGKPIILENDKADISICILNIIKKIEDVLYEWDKVFMS